jgi:hypothetical protein
VRFGARIGLVVLPLVVGAYVYLRHRRETLWMFEWCRCVGLENGVIFLRTTDRLPVSLPDWVRFSLPDGLWASSGTALMAEIWREERPSLSAIAWIAIVPLIGVASELGQRVGWVPGEFAWADVVAYVAGASFPMVLHRLFREKSC